MGEGVHPSQTEPVYFHLQASADVAPDSWVSWDTRPPPFLVTPPYTACKWPEHGFHEEVPWEELKSISSVLLFSLSYSCLSYSRAKALFFLPLCVCVCESMHTCVYVHEYECECVLLLTWGTVNYLAGQSGRLLFPKIWWSSHYWALLESHACC